ncbi:MAG: hypothetical protein ACLFOY_14475 [Desulfatibacillaceae bacterium]
MSDIRMRTYESVPEFLRILTDVFRGPTFLETFLRLDGRFREKVILEVSITNNCAM